jgi:hypothetical protein
MYIWHRQRSWVMKRSEMGSWWLVGWLVKLFWLNFQVPILDLKMSTNFNHQTTNNQTTKGKMHSYCIVTAGRNVGGMRRHRNVRWHFTFHRMRLSDAWSQHPICNETHQNIRIFCFVEEGSSAPEAGWSTDNEFANAIRKDIMIKDIREGNGLAVGRWLLGYEQKELSSFFPLQVLMIHTRKWYCHLKRVLKHLIGKDNCHISFHMY